MASGGQARDPPRGEGKPDDKLEIPLSLPGLHLKEAKATAYQDLSPHPWAGLPVNITVVATDALGQTGESEPVRMDLPERTFTNPVARAIIEQRKELVKDPSSRDGVAEILDDFNKQPALFHDDTVAFLALRLAALRLRQPDVEAAIAAVVPLLWDTALRIEDGRVSVAEQDLRRLQQQLQEALARGASDEEIDKLRRELREAVIRYLQALAEEMRNRPADENQQPIDPSKVLTSRDLQRMLDRARQLAHSGAQQQARELLSQMQDMLENLRTARPSQSQHGSGDAEQMMRGMRDMMQKQQQLLDRSFRAQRGQNQRQGRNSQQQQGQMGQQGQPGDGQDGAPMGDLGDSAAQQEELRHALGEMMRLHGRWHGRYPRSARARRASDAGRRRRAAAGGAEEAISPQSQVGRSTSYSKARRDFAQQMQERMSKGWGSPGDDEGTVGAPDQADRDPFGRPLSSNGSYDQGDVAIPEEGVLQKSRQILDELRRRAGERARPTIELDYIDRLLRRF